MSTTIQQTESGIVLYPNMSFPPAVQVKISTDAIWARLESYIAHRWPSRAVVWIVEGPGEWHPPLTPATISTVEVWCHRAGEWETATLGASPLGGYVLHHTGPYRFTGTAGDDSDVPDTIRTALYRLGHYMAAQPEKAGANFESTSIGGDLTTSYKRDANWMAMAMQNSGAADLLRAYRRV